MNKYLKGLLNSIIGLAIGFVGLLFSLNILAMGYIFFPQVAIQVDQLMISNPIWWKDFIPGTLPLFFLLTIMGFSVLSMFITIKLMKKVDVEKIVNAIQKEGGKVSEKADK